MRLHRVAVQNIRSFLDRQELETNGPISIIVGPNGGGKTNLLDAVVVILRRYMFSSVYQEHVPTTDEPNRWRFAQNDQLNQMTLERHMNAPKEMPQLVEVEIEVTPSDIESMTKLKKDAPRLIGASGKVFLNANLYRPEDWNIENITPGTRLIYRWDGGAITSDGTPAHRDFLSFLQIFEMDSFLRSELHEASLQIPMIYLGINRSSSSFQSRVSLAGYNYTDLKRSNDASFSRNGTNIVQIAIGELADKFRRMQESDNTQARQAFLDDPDNVELRSALALLGYSWNLETINYRNNEYDVGLTKQNTKFMAGFASSGEKELLTYVFAIYALKVRDALIVVDEPELHLHPRWQKSLLQMFERLSASTGNQFLLATHSAVFISPSSIQYVSRVYSDSQQSRIVRLNQSDLPNSKHFFNVVNSQNNEKLFFADTVVLVEGMHDRMMFEKLLERRAKAALPKLTVEVISVGGKGLFPAYLKLLAACKINALIVADLDYIEQIGTDDLRSLFQVNEQEIQQDVINNVKSMDAAALVLRIDQAMGSGDWSDAQDLWEYIKGRRIRIKPELSNDEEKTLFQFIDSRKPTIHVLKRGSLEDYLPEGMRSKDTEKLIAFLAQETFYDNLLPEGRAELDGIIDNIVALQ
jgi:predicted ATPase